LKKTLLELLKVTLYCITGFRVKIDNKDTGNSYCRGLWPINSS
jgi:hypothetical protein